MRAHPAPDLSGSSMLAHRESILENHLHVSEDGNVLERIPGDDDEVGELARLESADKGAKAEGQSRVTCRGGENGLRWSGQPSRASPSPYESRCPAAQTDVTGLE